MKIAKTVLEFEKTQHFMERQIEREVKDSEIIFLLNNGAMREQGDGTTVFSNGEAYLVVNRYQRVLITVYPGQKMAKVKLKVLFKKVS